MKDQLQHQTTHYSTPIIVIITGASCLGNTMSPINKLTSIYSMFDNNSPTQWSIKMKFVPLGSPLKSTQMCSKLLHLVKGQRSYEAVKVTHTFTMGKWFDHSSFEHTYLTAKLWSTYMAALQYQFTNLCIFH